MMLPDIAVYNLVDSNLEFTNDVCCNRFMMSLRKKKCPTDWLMVLLKVSKFV